LTRDERGKRGTTERQYRERNERETRVDRER